MFDLIFISWWSVSFHDVLYKCESKLHLHGVLDCQITSWFVQHIWCKSKKDGTISIAS